MEISFVIDPLSVVLGIVLNWVIVFTIAAVVAVRTTVKKQRQAKAIKNESIDLDNWKL